MILRIIVCDLKDHSVCAYVCVLRIKIYDLKNHSV